jgi:hypothetical protein
MHPPTHPPTHLPTSPPASAKLANNAGICHLWQRQDAAAGRAAFERGLRAGPKPGPGRDAGDADAHALAWEREGGGDSDAHTREGLRANLEAATDWDGNFDARFRVAY